MKIKIGIFLLSIIFSTSCTFQKANAQSSALAIVSDKMNVFYFGIGNPICIADSGFVSDKINATINNDTLHGNNGKYVIKIKKPTISNETLTGNNGKCIVKFAEKIKSTTVVSSQDGRKVTLQEFNVKIPKSELEKIGNVFLGFEDFPVDLNFIYEVKSFNLSRKSTQGYFINDTKYYITSGAEKAMQSLFKASKPGEIIYITDIWVRAPKGDRTIPNINITVK